MFKAPLPDVSSKNFFRKRYTYRREELQYKSVATKIFLVGFIIYSDENLVSR